MGTQHIPAVASAIRAARDVSLVSCMGCGNIARITSNQLSHILTFFAHV